MEQVKKLMPRASKSRGVPSIQDKEALVGDQVYATSVQLMSQARLPRLEHTQTEMFWERAQSYLQWCVDNGQVPTKPGLAVHVNISKQTLDRWACEDDLMGEMITAVYDMMANNLEQLTMNGKVNPIGAIFLLKSTQGYREQSEVHHVTEQKTKTKTNEQLEKELEDAIINM